MDLSLLPWAAMVAGLFVALGAWIGSRATRSTAEQNRKQAIETAQFNHDQAITLAQINRDQAVALAQESRETQRVLARDAARRARREPWVRDLLDLACKRYGAALMLQECARLADNQAFRQYRDENWLRSQPPWSQLHWMAAMGFDRDNELGTYFRAEANFYSAAEQVAYRPTDGPMDPETAKSNQDAIRTMDEELEQLRAAISVLFDAADQFVVSER